MNTKGIADHIDRMVYEGAVSEFALVREEQWRSLQQNKTLSNQELLAREIRSRGKSWAPWIWLLRDQLAPDPGSEALRQAVVWHMRDQGNHSAKFFAEPRVFPVLKPAEDVA
jgi:hypothetical protein